MGQITPSVADLMTLVRDPVSAPSPYNLVLGETPNPPQGFSYGVAGTTLFYLANRPIVSGSVYATIGSTLRSQAGFTVDNTNGTMSFAAYPTGTPFLIDYNYNFFAATDYTFFIGKGLDSLGFIGASTIDELLSPACYEAAKGFFYEARATQYADRYKSSGGGLGQDIDVVTANFMKLANDAWKRSLVLRDDYYKRQGQRNAPSSHFLNYGMGDITPRR